MGMFDEIGQAGLDPLQSQGYCVDIAMLIDATGSMAPIINEVKNNAMAFCTSVTSHSFLKLLLLKI